MKKVTPLFMSAALMAQSSWALNINQLAGTVINHNSPNGKVESCVIANKLFTAAYSKKDIKAENELCAMNFYNTVGLCPKSNSTNPGILVTEIPEGQNRDYVQKICLSDNDDIKVVAKFKQTISCSNTSSILAYYHFSKILDMGRVPTAVLRTMDKNEHLKEAQIAPKLLKGKENELISKTWNMFAGEHTKMSNLAIFDDSKQYVYGALSENPKKESKYSELNKFKSYETRYTDFAANSLVARLSDARSVTQILQGLDSQNFVQGAVQMKDLSEMIILDTLFNQQDRIGNIHSKFVWYKISQNSSGQIVVEQEKSKAEMASDKKTIIIPENEKSMKDKGYVLIKEMLMKDNDCGVSKQNMMKQLGLVAKLKHMSRSAYNRLLEFSKVSQDPQLMTWMKNELLMSNSEIGLSPNSNSFISNLSYVVSSLRTSCKNGQLKLDLDLKDIYSKRQQTEADCEGMSQ